MRHLCTLLSVTCVCAWGADELNGHRVELDGSGKILPWVQPADRAYDEVIRRAWKFLLEDVKVEDNGLKSYFSYCCLDLATMHGRAWPHNPACVNSGLAESAVLWYAYSGDRRPVELVKSLLDYQLAHGTTPAAGWKWPNVPYASADHGATEYRGAIEFQYQHGNIAQTAIGDGYGVIEPDKVGELGLAYLRFYKLTGETRYRDAAVACARALASNIREGTWNQSPWPFRVWGESGRVREEYSSNVIGPIKLFDEMMRTGLGDTASYRNAREQAWAWMMKFPVSNGLWSGYFEDVYLQHFPNNLNQYSPMETAKYLLEHPDLDSQWREHANTLIGFVEQHFVIDVPNEPAVQWGANAVSEQVLDVNKMGSHTSRYASGLALWSERTGDVSAKEKAKRSLTWASYMCRDNGFVHVGPVDRSLWFSDGYGDYIRHFVIAMAAVPEWAPNHADHLLRSTSLVTTVSYRPREVVYRTYEPESTEVLRLGFRPAAVVAGTQKLSVRPALDADGYTVAPLGDDFVVRIRHSSSGEVRVAAE